MTATNTSYNIQVLHHMKILLSPVMYAIIHKELSILKAVAMWLVKWHFIGFHKPTSIVSTIISSHTILYYTIFLQFVRQ